MNIATIGEIGPWSDGGDVFKTWLNDRSPTPAVELADKVLTDELLKPFQIVIVLYLRRPRSAATVEPSPPILHFRMTRSPHFSVGSSTVVA
ncbi:MAG TPA: hypothetical protein VGI70_09260 [Polyangiales bacterium]